MQWKTLEDLCGSDHYPISVSCGSTETSSAVPSWKLRKADWPSFSREAKEQLGCSKKKVNFVFEGTTQCGLMIHAKKPSSKERKL